MPRRTTRISLQEHSVELASSPLSVSKCRTSCLLGVHDILRTWVFGINKSVALPRPRELIAECNIWPQLLSHVFLSSRLYDPVSFLRPTVAFYPFSSTVSKLFGRCTLCPSFFSLSGSAILKIRVCIRFLGGAPCALPLHRFLLKDIVRRVSSTLAAFF